MSNEKQGKQEREFKFGPWKLTSCHSSILQSNCSCSHFYKSPMTHTRDAIDTEGNKGSKTKCYLNASTEKNKDFKDLKDGNHSNSDIHDKSKTRSNEHKSSVLTEQCPLCRFLTTVPLPNLPEMIYFENHLTLHHQSGCSISFNALDALKLVDSEKDSVKVAGAKEWQTTRVESDHIKTKGTPYDWTFTTDYKGTMQPDCEIKVSETMDRIDTEKLKKRENILFYDEVHLFEDELADNGIAQLSVKVRVMPTSFFILLRFSLRVDGVLLRFNDTRIYHEGGSDFLLREYTSKENSFEKLSFLDKHTLYNDPNSVMEHLELKKQVFEKLSFPA